MSSARAGVTYVPFAGVALETQHFPDSPNQPSFPPTILRPGDGFTSRTVYRFSVSSSRSNSWPPVFHHGGHGGHGGHARKQNGNAGLEDNRATRNRTSPCSRVLRGTDNTPVLRWFMRVLIFAALVVVAGHALAQQPAYRNTSLPFEQRAADLVSRMTLEEKVVQMKDVAPAIERLGVPAYNWWNEALHGVARSGLATVFPQADRFRRDVERQPDLPHGDRHLRRGAREAPRVRAQQQLRRATRGSRSGRRTSTSSATRGGDAGRRRTARTRSSPAGSPCSSSAGCRATIRSTSRPSRR